jgi:hypothetical protein
MTNFLKTQNIKIELSPDLQNELKDFALEMERSTRPLTQRKTAS